MSSPAPSTSSIKTNSRTSILVGEQLDGRRSEAGGGAGEKSEGESTGLDQESDRDQPNQEGTWESINIKPALAEEQQQPVNRIRAKRGFLLSAWLTELSSQVLSAPERLPAAQNSPSPVTLTHTSTHILIPCSSCGAEPSLASVDWVLLLPCGRHLLCPACLTQLVNGVSNDPPRPGMCFADGTEVESFEGVVWTEGAGEGLEDIAGEEPIKEDGVREWIKSTGLSFNVGVVEGGGGLDTHPATPGSARSYR
jgi:hypothetical protein